MPNGTLRGKRSYARRALQQTLSSIIVESKNSTFLRDETVRKCFPFCQFAVFFDQAAEILAVIR
ncbi:hypothetical protein H6G54_24525 [Anabaena cylindrica FACHB-243]|uniref:Uncharacterized protein n=1 Tax=Anabaena cylindrica (strain ATCC 27899 / PCC 7122) TaxID=272123 RepID=K9ZJ64_ANACC|nr:MULTISPECIES: hypothetical protein [Anabaena]AFZ58804.1 hypothetical protein Anacy_3402 [Anabaena cylindrica PCC 7122]MBD2420808.1 hypothetical protein [Anabaena cylindrica FACHB-243]MBY5282599.1 hypothetical protein [Anabaena sp. CCAP 1446/1C]MBY5311135.1 hypothetical protein [Anabaena sp. CCAP 1446/1C]MCM2409429.1 hypothetical protein [Anabaena sp. CCAP 1446/1C]